MGNVGFFFFNLVIQLSAIHLIDILNNSSQIQASKTCANAITITN